MKKFLCAYLHNLLLITLAIGSMVVLTKVFYPETLSLFSFIGRVYSALNLWPIFVVILLIAALPRRR